MKKNVLVKGICNVLGKKVIKELKFDVEVGELIRRRWRTVVNGVFMDIVRKSNMMSMVDEKNWKFDEEVLNEFKKEYWKERREYFMKKREEKMKEEEGKGKKREMSGEKEVKKEVNEEEEKKEVKVIDVNRMFYYLYKDYVGMEFIKCSDEEKKKNKNKVGVIRLVDREGNKYIIEWDRKVWDDDEVFELLQCRIDENGVVRESFGKEWKVLQGSKEVVYEGEFLRRTEGDEKKGA